VLTCGLIDPDKAQELSADMDARLKAARAALAVRQVVRVKALWFITKGVICGLPGGLTGFNPAYRLTRDAKAPEPWKVLKLGEEFDAKIKVMGADDFILVSRRSLFPRTEQKKPAFKKKTDAKKKPAPTVEVRVSAAKPKNPAAPPIPMPAVKVATPPAKPKVRHIIRG
jgi:ABC-type Fe3+-hydroxamate transport system substrate-binding protein